MLWKIEQYLFSKNGAKIDAIVGDGSRVFTIQRHEGMIRIEPHWIFDRFKATHAFAIEIDRNLAADQQAVFAFGNLDVIMEGLGDADDFIPEVLQAQFLGRDFALQLLGAFFQVSQINACCHGVIFANTGRLRNPVEPNLIHKVRGFSHIFASKQKPQT